jgi:hypothetical protein
MLRTTLLLLLASLAFADDQCTSARKKLVDTMRENLLPADTAKSGFPFGTINHSCGPEDGPALDIRLTPSKDTKKGAWIDLSIYRDLPQLPLSAAKTYELNTGNDASATRCRSVGHCVAADSGTLTLTRLDGTGGAGHYKLHLKDGTAEEGHFDLRWIEVKMDCD